MSFMDADFEKRCLDIARAVWSLENGSLNCPLSTLAIMAGKGLPGPLRLLILLAFSFLIASSLSPLLVSAVVSQEDALLQFKSTLAPYGGEDALSSWASGSQACSGSHSNWKGVLCANGMVWGLQLEGLGLSGSLDVTPLGNLPNLRAVSFMNNNFVGPMPDIAKLGALKSLYISNNQFSGDIPDGAFLQTRSLKKIFMSNNEFTGKIPSSLTQLTKLMFLRLDSNSFDGEIPDLEQPGLKLMNVSYNQLEGKIPESVSDMDPSLFAGNKNLCGPPLQNQCPAPPSKKLSIGLIILIVIASIIALIILCCIVSALCRRSTEGRSDTLSHEYYGAARSTASNEVESIEQGSSAITGRRSSGSSIDGNRRSSRDGEHGKLSFIKEVVNESDRFELQDLLRASAEVLGSGDFGSSYKAVLVNGPSVVVKRFKEMNRVGREDFQEHMRRLGRLSHPNVLPVVAYYYRKEEKLLITNYILNGSLAHMLHGNRGSNLPPLEWPTRLRIIKGVARGLAYLYEELPMLTLPHGHLKSSNVLIDDNYEPLLTDYALVPVVNQTHASQVMVAYKSPEVAQTGKPSKKSDVWSLGILILELLTGKFPATYLQKGKGGDTDLAGWVSSVVGKQEEEWNTVFESDMKGTKNGEGEMLKLLKIGLSCCEVDVAKRLDMKDALEKIEQLKERENDSLDDSASVLTEVELHSSSMDRYSFSDK